MTLSAADLLRRHLRQRADLGETEVLLQSLSATELLQLLPQSGGAAAVEEVAAPARPRPTSRPVHQPVVETPDDAPVAADFIQLGTMAELRQVALGCPRCRLAETRRQVVFGEGNETAELMVVGEAPGAEEDRQGRPFVGRAGQFLDRLLLSVGFPRESVYICNVLKCRPPGNRDPEPDEVEACSAYLYRQVELVAPKAILAVGTFSAQTLLGSRDPISRLRGRVHRFRGIDLVPTYHPAALLRNRGWIRPAWEDLQLLRTVLAGEYTQA